MTQAIVPAHWREYLIEFAGSATLLFATCIYATALGHPSSPIVSAIPVEFHRRLIMGVLMAVTVFGMANTSWAKRSGGHFNPAVTFTFWRLKKVWAVDAGFYAAFQFFGAMTGMAIGVTVLGRWIAAPEVGYVATHPGAAGQAVACVAECAMTAILMSVVLWTSNSHRLHSFTPWFVAASVAGCIIFGAPFSGTGLNPARSFAPEVYAGMWNVIWIYFAAPTVGMLLGAQLFLAFSGSRVVCAKLHHHNSQPCPFRCEYASWVSEHEQAL